MGLTTLAAWCNGIRACHVDQAADAIVDQFARVSQTTFGDHVSWVVGDHGVED